MIERNIFKFTKKNTSDYVPPIGTPEWPNATNKQINLSEDRHRTLTILQPERILVQKEAIEVREEIDISVEPWGSKPILYTDHIKIKYIPEIKNGSTYTIIHPANYSSSISYQTINLDGIDQQDKPYNYSNPPVSESKTISSLLDSSDPFALLKYKGYVINDLSDLVKNSPSTLDNVDSTEFEWASNVDKEFKLSVTTTIFPLNFIFYERNKTSSNSKYFLSRGETVTYIPRFVDWREVYVKKGVDSNMLTRERDYMLTLLAESHEDNFNESIERLNLERKSNGLFEPKKRGEKRDDTGCCDSPTDIHQIIKWNYTPSGDEDTINVVENTVYRNDTTSYVFIEGQNYLNENNEIKGDLSIEYRCVSPCQLMLQKNYTPLRMVQIFGDALAIDWERGSLGGYSKVLPQGSIISVQCLGGFGTLRKIFSSNPKVAAVNKRFASNGQAYRPEMQILAPHQVSRNCFDVDRSLGDGNHIFDVEIKERGNAVITVVDEGGCSSSFQISGASDLTSPNTPLQKKPTPPKINYKPSDKADRIWNDGTLFGGYDELNASSPNPIPHSLKPKDTFQKKYNWGISAGFNIQVYGQGDEFISGTSVISNGQIHANNKVDMAVGEKATATMPNGTERWSARVILTEAGGEFAGVGFDSNNLIPWGGGFANDRRMVGLKQKSTKEFEIECKTPTNHTPVLVHFYKPRGNVIGPPNPTGPFGDPMCMRLMVTNEGTVGQGNPKLEAIDGGIKLTRWNGSVSRTKFFRAGTDRFMTGDSFFISTRCFCKAGVMDDVVVPSNPVKREKHFNLNLSPNLPANKSWYFAPDDVGKVNTKLLDPLVMPPDEDDTGPQRQPFGKFYTTKKDEEAFTVWQTPWVFWSESTALASPPHVDYFKAFETQWFKDGRYYLNIKEKEGSQGKHFTFPDDEYYKDYNRTGVTDQPRGSWCVYNNTFKMSNITPIMVLQGIENPVMLNEKTRVFSPITTENQEIIIEGQGGFISEDI